MNQKGNSVIGNQSIVSEGALKGVTEGIIEGVLEDLSVENPDAIKGGPLNVRNSGGGYDIIVFDIVDSHH